MNYLILQYEKFWLAGKPLVHLSNIPKIGSKSLYFKESILELIEKNIKY